MSPKRLQPVPEASGLTQAVQTTLDALILEPADTGAAELARKYAAAIDDLAPDDMPRLIGTIGPSLLRALEALGATPAARAKVAGNLTGPRQLSPLEKLRADRAAHRQ